MGIIIIDSYNYLITPLQKGQENRLTFYNTTPLKCNIV